MNVIYPQNRLDFGIPNSQGFAYAKNRSLNKIPEDFLAQPRPSGPILESISKEKSVRQHSAPGLLSIPKNGLGYGGTGFENDDEAFASSFEITAANVPSMDRENRKQKLIVNLFHVHSEKSDLIWFRIRMHEKMGPVKI